MKCWLFQVSGYLSINGKILSAHKMLLSFDKKSRNLITISSMIGIRRCYLCSIVCCIAWVLQQIILQDCCILPDNIYAKYIAIFAAAILGIFVLKNGECPVDEKSL